MILYIVIKYILINHSYEIGNISSITDAIIGTFYVFMIYQPIY